MIATVCIPSVYMTSGSSGTTELRLAGRLRFSTTFCLLLPLGQGFLSEIYPCQTGGRCTTQFVMTTRPPSWIGRNHISIFVHSLHFLDLDLLEDWPEVTIDTFDSKSDLQHRLRCVEWSLYRLFELYDRRSTKDVGLSNAYAMLLSTEVV